MFGIFYISCGKSIRTLELLIVLLNTGEATALLEIVALLKLYFGRFLPEETMLGVGKGMLCPHNFISLQEDVAGSWERYLPEIQQINHKH